MVRGTLVYGHITISYRGNLVYGHITIRYRGTSVYGHITIRYRGTSVYGHITIRYSPRHKHGPAGPAHFLDRRTSSGQYILSVTGPYGPPRYMSGHQISNSAGPNDDNSQYVFFARSPVPHLGSFRAALLLQRDASVSRVRVGHVNQTHCLDHAALQREHPGRIRALFSTKHMSWFRVNSFAFWSVNLKY